MVDYRQRHHRVEGIAGGGQTGAEAMMGMDSTGCGENVLVHIDTQIVGGRDQRGQRAAAAAHVQHLTAHEGLGGGTMPETRAPRCSGQPSDGSVFTAAA